MTVTVIPVNDTPIAKDDYVETNESTLLTGSTLLANDSDVDKDQLKVNTTPVVTPLHGTLKLNEDGTYTYEPVFEYYGPDSFTYEVCDSGNPTLCAQATVSINVIRTADLLVYEGISPNNDGKNDAWFIRDIDLYPGNKVSIYNRWGNLVYEERGYDNVNKVWSGISNRGHQVGGNELPDGTYFYIISLGNGSKLVKGYVVLNR